MENSLVSPLNGKRYGEAYAENHNEVQQTIVRHALQRYLLDEKAVKQPNAHRKRVSTTSGMGLCTNASIKHGISKNNISVYPVTILKNMSRSVAPAYTAKSNVL